MLLIFQDWSGDGIAEIKIRKTDKKRTEVEYKAGAFGYMFDFSLVFWFEPQSLVRFEVSSPPPFLPDLSPPPFPNALRQCAPLKV